jgi:riboflavin synthase
MFTGIVAAVGRIVETAPTEGGIRLRINAEGLGLDDVAIGDSIAVNGVCLTVVALAPHAFEADVSRETLSCASGFDPDQPVNLEKALRLADRIGGHLVTGHVDGIGRIDRIDRAGDNCVVEISLPLDLARYVARKGSVAVDGVSLTVNAVSDAAFTVNLIPHTLAHTRFAALETGAPVNIEIDLLARYVERMNSHSPNK